MKGKPLTMKSVLTSLDDVLRAVRIDGGGSGVKGGKSALKGISRALEERIDYILAVAKLFAELQGSKDFVETGPIGFGDRAEDGEGEEGE